MQPMNKSHRNNRILYVMSTSDRELLDQLDDLVARAARGDRQAVGAIAVAFGPMLVQEARKVLAPLFELDVEDVVDRFFWDLLRDRLAFPPIRGAAVAWMKRRVREGPRRRCASGVGDGSTRGSGGLVDRAIVTEAVENYAHVRLHPLISPFAAPGLRLPRGPTIGLRSHDRCRPASPP